MPLIKAFHVTRRSHLKLVVLAERPLGSSGVEMIQGYHDDAGSTAETSEMRRGKWLGLSDCLTEIGIRIAA